MFIQFGSIKGSFTIIGENQISTEKMFIGLCNCGQLKQFKINELENENFTSCHCKINKNNKYIGMSFNNLIIIKENEKRFNNRYFLCKCICGKEREFALSNLKTNKSKHCGCLTLNNYKEESREELVNQRKNKIKPDFTQLIIKFKGEMSKQFLLKNGYPIMLDDSGNLKPESERLGMAQAMEERILTLQAEAKAHPEEPVNPLKGIFGD